MNIDMERLKHINDVISEVSLGLAMVATGKEEVTLTKKEINSILKSLDEVKKDSSELIKMYNYTTAKDLEKRLKDVSAPQEDMVYSPKHYKSGKYQCIDVMQEIFGREKVSAFCELNAFKYLWRSNNKGADLQDKEKARWYISKYIDLNTASSNG